jgi:MoaA/NifB/PqqE/SkfB family radical SAM enzyme
MLTNRCNMKCAHCCFACTSKGTDMSRETFLKACKIAEDYGETLFIGGGEPTLHPLLFDFIGIALSFAYDDPVVGIVTNGKLTEPARRLAQMARQGIISADLSQDIYHEPIDPDIVALFQKNKLSLDDRLAGRTENDRDYRGVRNTSRHIMAVGRGRKVSGAEQGCACEELFCAPDGTLFGCGCRLHSLGTVDRPQIPSNYNRECQAKTKECEV